MGVFKYIYRIQMMIYVFLLFSVFIPSEGTYLYPKQNHLARVIHKWGPSFLVQFDLKVLSFHGYGTNRHRSILRFSDNTYDDYHVDGSRIPALLHVMMERFFIECPFLALQIMPIL